MTKKGVCIFNKHINCRDQVKGAKCNWNPTYFEQLKQERREARESKRGKRNEK